MDALAADTSAVTGIPVVYQGLPAQDHADALAEADLPQPVVEMFAAIDASTADGWLADITGDLCSLSGPPTTPPRTTLAAELGN
jgi:NAD(P)H dehydrogenase (quinone)